ncbi:Uncharacterised protein [Vibrio cholerae]|nr:Uncharacterised protein [Vibrio cholerae]CSI55316.1 Uncharacterised protein [Vibrio cholerae]
MVHRATRGFNQVVDGSLIHTIQNRFVVRRYAFGQGH